MGPDRAILNELQQALYVFQEAVRYIIWEGGDWREEAV